MKPIPAIAEAAAKANVPNGVAQGIAMDLAKVPGETAGVLGAVTKKLSDREIADKWGLSLRKVKSFKSEPGLLDQVRAVMTERAMILGALLMDSMVEDFSNPEIMAKVSPPDKARSLKAVCDAVVTLQDGHAKPTQINLGNLMEQFKTLETAKEGLRVVEG